MNAEKHGYRSFLHAKAYLALLLAVWLLRPTAAFAAGGAYAATGKSSVIESTIYSVDRAAGLLKGVSKQTSASLLISNLGNAREDLAVFGQDGALYDGPAVGTGMTVALRVGGVVQDSLRIVVTGDTNGDGDISVSDYTLARLDILDQKKLEGVFRYACDANGDGTVTITDYTLMRLDILGLKPIDTKPSQPDEPNERVKAMLDLALSLQGKPYVLGDEGPNTFDCSGFVYYCLNQTGYAVGRTTADSYSKNADWPLVAKENLQPGDLLFFFSDSRPGVIGHIAIYNGNGTIVHASSSYGCVVLCPLDGWYEQNLSHARRVFN